MAASRKEQLLSRRQVEAMIADGRKVFIFEGRVIKADAWLPFHPGGDKAIMHMVGRDATDEFTVLHSPEARAQMLKYQVGRVEGRWLNFLPPIQGGKFRTLLEEQEEEDEGCESSSSNNSTPPSPVFDPVDGSTQVRRRKSVTSSISSTSTPPSESESRFAFMDARTQKEILLDQSTYPSLEPEKQDEIVQKYRALHQRLIDEGLFECHYTRYLFETMRYITFFSLFLYFLRTQHFCLSGLFLGCLWHQLVFTVHDAGHMGITHNFQVDTVLGIVIADFIGGLSLGWWKRNHNVHHIVTNSPEHDPDIEHMPLFAISHRFFNSLRSTYYERVMTFDAAARFLVKYQHYLYYPILLFGRFNLYRLTWEYLLLGQAPKKGPAWWHRWLEISGQVVFWYWFGYIVCYKSIPDAQSRTLFILISHMVTSPLHVQITLSHFAMSTADLGVHESFPQRQLRTTMDVDCAQWLDWVHGGLQFQAIHHLYPRMPRHNLRTAQKRVMEFCNDTGIPYAVFTFVSGNKEVIGRLGDVAKQARIFQECQRTVMQEGPESWLAGEHAHHH